MIPVLTKNDIDFFLLQVDIESPGGTRLGGVRHMERHVARVLPTIGTVPAQSINHPLLFSYVFSD
jgi:hypothetical protein